MKRLVLSVVILLAGLFLVPSAKAAGFDQYGYNNTARNFVGTGSSWCQGKIGWDKTTCDTYMGAYANDKVVMKWNAAWDACNDFGTDEACAGAWTDNEWNGMKGGSRAVWHYKIVWIPESCTPEYSLLPNGGECIWGHYEMIMDQGKDPSYGLGHFIFGFANPAGYGSFK